MRLVTQRLLMREFVAEDWRAVHEYASDPFVVRYNTFGPNTEEQTKDYIETTRFYARQRRRYHYEFAVTLRNCGPLIGACSLVLRTPECQQGELGYCYHPRWWNHGYATEAGQALMRLGFDRLNLNRIFARRQRENGASARVLEKLRLRQEGLMLESELVKGTWRSIAHYAMLRAEWALCQADFPPCEIQEEPPGEEDFDL